MSTNCYTGTAMPSPTQEPCNGEYTSTNCIIFPQALIYLDLPENSSMSQIVSALILALVRKDEQIEELQQQINELNNEL